MFRHKATYVVALLGIAVTTMALHPTDTPHRGPPWMSIELPANPLDRTTRGAAFVVHTYHHAQPAIDKMTGTAEGLIDGRRESIPLEFSSTTRANVFAVQRTWPARGDWVLAIRGSSDATLLVHLGPDGGLENRPYYGQPAHLAAVRSVQVVEGAPGDRQIARMLREAGDR